MDLSDTECETFGSYALLNGDEASGMPSVRYSESTSLYCTVLGNNHTRFTEGLYKDPNRRNVPVSFTQTLEF